jgi:hypothetical protein
VLGRNLPPYAPPTCMAVAVPTPDPHPGGHAVNNEPVPGSQLHVRGVGVHGWDGTAEGKGDFEDEDALTRLFSSFGTCVQSTVRHRIDATAEKNTSWAIVTMGSKVAADLAVAADMIMAGTEPLVVNLFSPATAATSTVRPKKCSPNTYLDAHRMATRAPISGRMVHAGHDGTNPAG